jgi:6-phosphogluconolactonase
MGSYELHRFTSPQGLATAAAIAWMKLLEGRTGSTPSVALAGGRIAGVFFSATAQLPDSPELLANVHFFWGDERCVPPFSPESNFLLARERLLGPLGIQDARIHRIKGELEPGVAADEASSELRRIAPSNTRGAPVLRLAFLGMGEDGHVASLFPGEPKDLVTSPALYRPVIAPKPPPQRITLGYSTLAAAEQVWVLASGAGKSGALITSLQLDSPTPFGHLLALRSHTRIYTDIPAVGGE